MVDRAIAALPRERDAERKTCRAYIYSAISEAAGESIGGSPWAVEIEVALHKLCVAVDRAIDADPIAKEIFDRPATLRKIEVFQSQFADAQ
jgi:hypothetical protein